ncbi:hypothetical protein ACFLQW_04505, partial [Candidatus Zixiibacteriota bacterium]
MTHKFRMAMITVLLILSGATLASAEWRINIDSVSVDAGDTAKLDFYGYWDLPLTGLTVPLVVKEIDPGAFWANSL